ncbi:hypothetical protein BCV70DRAFT_201605 [Testicularia cyperi]|uniref:Uncharacterized protein n=1 Tax=Testicularia cyperi TaxID=1882483 RepID=A0A317XKF9_9BASI|nr:hypothetical protein BCV70DRAFT_201605 [Testicularia cyperi]
MLALPIALASMHQPAGPAASNSLHTLVSPRSLPSETSRPTSSASTTSNFSGWFTFNAAPSTAASECPATEESSPKTDGSAGGIWRSSTSSGAGAGAPTASSNDQGGPMISFSYTVHGFVRADQDTGAVCAPPRASLGDITNTLSQQRAAGSMSSSAQPSTPILQPQDYSSRDRQTRPAPSRTPKSSPPSSSRSEINRRKRRNAISLSLDQAHRLAQRLNIDTLSRPEPSRRECTTGSENRFTSLELDRNLFLVARADGHTFACTQGVCRCSPARA